MRPLATGPTAIFFMYMRGTRVIPPGSQAARIESAPTPPRDTTPAPSTGSQASSSGVPPPPMVAPGARAWPCSLRPITTVALIGSASTAFTNASLAASSAARGSPLPR